MRKIQQSMDLVQDQMLGDNKTLDEIQQWAETQKNTQEK